MARTRPELENHLSRKEIKERHKEAVGKEKMRWQILLLLSAPNTPGTYDEIAEIVGCSPRTVGEILRKYNREGPDGLVDGRSKNGSTPILSQEDQSELSKLVETGQHEDGGLWVSAKVAQWIYARTGVKVTEETGRLYLRRLNFTKKQPRPKHAKSATAKEQKAFKKK